MRSAWKSRYSLQVRRFFYSRSCAHLEAWEISIWLQGIYLVGDQLPTTSPRQPGSVQAALLSWKSIYVGELFCTCKIGPWRSRFDCQMCAAPWCERWLTINHTFLITSYRCCILELLFRPDEIDKIRIYFHPWLKKLGWLEALSSSPTICQLHVLIGVVLSHTVEVLPYNPALNEKALLNLMLIYDCHHTWHVNHSRNHWGTPNKAPFIVWLNGFGKHGTNKPPILAW